MSISKELAAAYIATEYRVFAPDGTFTIRIGEKSPELASLQAAFNVTSSAFITAYNPLSQPTEDAVNRQNQERLIEENSFEWKYLLGEGVDPNGEWPSEPSILILGIDELAAIAIGHRFGQNAILFMDAQGEISLRACNPIDPFPPKIEIL